jgi:hypothetical protein
LQYYAIKCRAYYKICEGSSALFLIDICIYNLQSLMPTLMFNLASAGQQLGERRDNHLLREEMVTRFATRDAVRAEAFRLVEAGLVGGRTALLHHGIVQVNGRDVVFVHDSSCLVVEVDHTAVGGCRTHGWRGQGEEQLCLGLLGDQAFCDDNIIISSSFAYLYLIRRQPVLSRLCDIF